MRDQVWICRDGRRLLVSEMSDSHIANCIRLIQLTGWRRQYLERLRLEEDIRRMGLRDDPSTAH